MNSAGSQPDCTTNIVMVNELEGIKEDWHDDAFGHVEPSFVLLSEFQVTDKNATRRRL